MRKTKTKDGLVIGGDGVRTWEEFLEWIDGFKTINTQFVYNDQPNSRSTVAEADPVGVEGTDEELVKGLLMEAVTELIGDVDPDKVWIRVKPEVNEIKGTITPTFRGYARIAVMRE